MLLNIKLSLIFGFLINASIFGCLAFICLKFLKSFFPVSISSERSALFHVPTIRGIGIIFPISLLLSSCLLLPITEVLNFQFLLIFICTLIGFYDDLKNIKYYKKLLFLSSLFLLFLLLDRDILVFSDLNIILSVIISLLFFIFYVLFFNQIDGINGLSSGTFCIFLAGIVFFKSENLSSNVMFINILGIIFFYFLLNMMHIKFFQGDAGAYFLGSVSYFIFKENEQLIFISLIFLFPILADIIWTAILRLYLGYNLSQPHKNHLYQKSVSVIKAHSPITFFHLLVQIICIWVINFFGFNNQSLKIQFLILLIFCIFFSFFYIFTSYKFNKPR